MPVVEVAHCEYEAADDGTVTFTTTGAPSLTTWRFGDCTDEVNADAEVVEHVYSAGGTYEAIGHVHSTGQRMEMTVGVPDIADVAEGIVIDSITPLAAAQWTPFTLVVTGSGFSAVTQAMWFKAPSTNQGASSFTVDSDTQVTVDSPAGMDVGDWNIGLDDGTFAWVKSTQAIVVT